MKRWPIEGHTAKPGPLYWDWRCTVCSKPVRDHAPWIVQFLRKLFSRPYDPDGDREGTWIRHVDIRPPFVGKVSYTWLPDALDPDERCPSEECLFGREWIRCKKRKGHKGIHRNCETWGWDEGDERA